MNKVTAFIILALATIIIGSCSSSSSAAIEAEEPSLTGGEMKQERIIRNFLERDFITNTNIHSIPLHEVFSGGPAKDGIPAINNPKFVSVEQTNLDPRTQGIFVEFSDVQRYYPYTILVWHEIVNDSIGDTHFAPTFCPLCGSAIVFNREIDEEIVNFGVSGLLYQSNLLMYDSASESLWSQARGDAVIGSKTGKKLERLPMQLLTFGEVQERYPNTEILSENTGFDRNYGEIPYGDYDNNEKLIFPVSVNDNRFHPKEIMYVVQVEDTSVAINKSELHEGKNEFDMDGKTYVVTKNGSEITVKDEFGRALVGYFEMWFSWATHHQKDGVVWNK